jgi:hypothetical protein
MVHLGMVVAWTAARRAQCGNEHHNRDKQPAPLPWLHGDVDLRIRLAEPHGGETHGPATARALPQVPSCSVTTNAWAKSPSL